MGQWGSILRKGPFATLGAFKRASKRRDLNFRPKTEEKFSRGGEN